MMEWGSRQNFVWLWALPLIVGVFYLASYRKKSLLKRFGDRTIVERLVASLDDSKRLVKRLCLLLSVFFIILALAQPHFKEKEVQMERRGMNIMIALDVSDSMLAQDITPNRLAKAKLELSTLIDQLKQDRIGIIAFAGEAFIQCPLTLDKSAVKLFLNTANPNLIPTPGTAIGSAIRVAVEAFDKKDKDFKVLILLTDGEDHESRPLEAAQAAAKEGVRIFTIGLGTQDGSTLPTASLSGEKGFRKYRGGEVVLSKLDEGLLRQIAQETGGAYYRASRSEAEVQQIVNRIRGLNQKALNYDKLTQYEESYRYFLFPAFLLLFFEMLISERKKEKNG